MANKTNKLIAVLSVILLLSGCGTIKEATSVEDKLSNLTAMAAEEQRKVEFHLTELADFEWDEAFFFATDTSADQLYSTLGQQVSVLPVKWLNSQHSNVLIVFKQDGRVTHFVKHSRKNGDPAANIFGFSFKNDSNHVNVSFTLEASHSPEKAWLHISDKVD